MAVWRFIESPLNIFPSPLPPSDLPGDFLHIPFSGTDLHLLKLQAVK